MRKIVMLLLMFFLSGYLKAQVTEMPVNIGFEQQMENIAESKEETETEDDTYAQELEQYARHPLNLNTADNMQLSVFPQLSMLQVNALLSYRNLLGNLLSIYELQAVPGWDISTIRQLRLYISVSDEKGLVENVKQRLRGGEHSLLLRVSQTLQKAQGFLVDPASGNSFYAGSPQKILLRYKYNYRRLLQYGVIGEKDAGEQFFKGAQKSGFDFYSAHFFLRNVGVVKALAIGDFTVSLGQGLTQWMGMAFSKGAEIANIKRQGNILKPYSCAGEINFHRGVGITLRRGYWETTVFGSFRKIDANIIPADSVTGKESVSALQTSGLHRTAAELADRHVQSQLVFGGNLSYDRKSVHLGCNIVQYRFSIPIIKRPVPYNLYAMNGRRFGNISADYSYTYKNMHIFGEAAMSANGGLAVVNGLLISMARNVDMSFLYRNISPDYQSLYTDVFTESSVPANEKGFFSGLSFKPGKGFKIDAYVDMFSFPWLRYRVNAPSAGQDNLLQATWKPSKMLEIYSRLRVESKAGNFTAAESAVTGIAAQKRQYWRTQLSFKVSESITIRNRMEFSRVKREVVAPENGTLFFLDLLYKPLMKPFSASVRWQYFETEGYDSRIYAYENDVLYSFSIPAYYGKGYLYYVNFHAAIGKKVDLWARYSRTIYLDRSKVGSGLDETRGFRREAIKVQLFYLF